jgi:energy-coupling factor transport system permease protein
VPSFLAGTVLAGAGLTLGSRQVRRSKYRPDPWRAPEWVVALSGVVPAVVLTAGAGFSVVSLNPSTDPLAWPALPVVPALVILIATLAAVAAPPPPRPIRKRPSVSARNDTLGGPPPPVPSPPPVEVSA